MKKNRFILKTAALLFALALLLTACDRGGGGQQEPPSTGARTGGTTPSAEPGGAEFEAMTLQLGHVQNTEHHYQTTAQAIADEISAATGGKVVIQIYPAEQLGSGRDQVESVKTNTQSMVFTPTAYLAGYDNIFDVLEMPYITKTYEEAKAFADTEAAAEFEKAAEAQGFVILGWAANGFHNVTGKKPITTPADMNNIRIRTGASQLVADMWACVNATATTISMGETYTALDNGTVECQANPTTNILANKLYEVQDYLIMTHHAFVFQPVVINKGLFDGMSPELQQLMRDTFDKYCREDVELVAGNEAAEIEQLKEYGMTVIEPDNAAFEEAFMPLYEQYASARGDRWSALVDLILK